MSCMLFSELHNFELLVLSRSLERHTNTDVVIWRQLSIQLHKCCRTVNILHCTIIYLSKIDPKRFKLLNGPHIVPLLATCPIHAVYSRRSPFNRRYYKFYSTSWLLNGSHIAIIKEKIKSGRSSSTINPL
jgi:hypothetical protein